MKNQEIRVLFVIVVLLSVMVLFAAVNADTLESNGDSIDSQLHVERAAPAFELKGFDGRTYRLSDFTDSIPVIVWFTNLCEGCQKNIPILDSIYREQIKPQAELLAISLLDKDRKTVEKVSGKLQFGFPVLYDPEGKTCKDYVGEYVPASCPITNLFVIDYEGVIRYESHYPGHQLTDILLILREMHQPEDNKMLRE